MGKQVVCTETAFNELEEILDFWKERNQSIKYSKKVLKNLRLVLNLLKNHPQLGRKTDYPNVRSRSFMSHFQIIYTIRRDTIYILSFWDSRQDPDANRYT